MPRCICRPGWEGEDCSLPVCSPQCMNGGSCSAPGAALPALITQNTMYLAHATVSPSPLYPGVCDCPAGFQGRSCEGGICSLPCQHGGQCIQRDTCRWQIKDGSGTSWRAGASPATTGRGASSASVWCLVLMAAFAGKAVKHLYAPEQIVGFT